jgi:DegV family protein with EDD domain
MAGEQEKPMVIVTGSTLQLSYERIEELGIKVVEYPLFVNGAPYPVSISMSRERKDELRELIMDKNNRVTTAGLQKDSLEKVYRGIGSDKIVSIHQSFNNSKATAEVLRSLRGELRDLDIYLFDTEHLTAGYTIQVLEAAKAIQNGIDFENLQRLLEKNRSAARHLGALYDLFFLKRSGRLGLAKAVLGTTMKIIPLLSSTEESGVIQSIGKARNPAQVNARFIQIMGEDLKKHNSRTLSAVIVYCGPHLQECERLKEMIHATGWDATVEIHYTNHSNMPHEGPDFYDIGYIVHGD